MSIIVITSMFITIIRYMCYVSHPYGEVAHMCVLSVFIVMLRFRLHKCTHFYDIPGYYNCINFLDVNFKAISFTTYVVFVN